MMEFHETRLFNGPQVYKAYTFYQIAESTLPESVKGVGLAMAQIMTSAGCKNEQAIVAALLRDMPADMQGILQERFGDWLPKLRKETELQHKNGYASVAKASEEAKLFMLAEHIYMMHLIVAENKPVIYDFYSFLGRVQGQTSCPTLEARYAIALATLSDHSEMYQPPSYDEPAAGPVDNMQIPYEQWGFVENANIRAAYDMISKDPRVTQRAFCEAASTASVLNAFLDDADVVVTALLDIAIGLEMGDKEVAVYGREFGMNVYALLSQGSALNKPYTNIQVPQLAQIAMAYTYVKVNMLRDDAEMCLRVLHQTSSEQEFVQQELKGILGEVEQCWKEMEPVMALAKMPELQSDLEREVKALTSALKEIGAKSAVKKTPKQPKP